MTGTISPWRQLREVVGAVISTIEPVSTPQGKPQQGKAADRRSS